ncbi:MAG TPA: TetR/AcrR family transcriptional regulator [Solirubrobacteraceae bacterium]|nr:TetR/AcrR family transcriptional regulator [Solirubrobacteraceae bacterium]
MPTAASTPTPKTTAPNRKSTQRQRLIEGMIAAANRDGYMGASVSKVIANAGVSRPTFYDYFEDRDDCFLAVHRDISERLLTQIHDAVLKAPPERAPQAAIRRLIERAEAEPAQAQFLANEAMAGGPRALDARDGTVREIERIIEEARAGAAPEAPSPDLPTRSLVGAAHWLLSQRLRRGELDLRTFADELEAWMESYDVPSGAHRWRTLQPGPEPEPVHYASDMPTDPPPPLPSGRTHLSSAEVAQNQRWRILFATAATAVRKGYAAATVADIAAGARVDKRVFYSHFRDKQQAFLAVHELAFQQTMAIAAGAYFSADSWPERLWRGIHAASQFEATHRDFVRLGYIESHALGGAALQRIDDSRRAFTIFLQEGDRYATKPQSRVAMEAVAAAIAEIGYEQARHEQIRQLPRFVGHATYLCLAPFLGPSAANEFVDGKLARG